MSTFPHHSSIRFTSEEMLTQVSNAPAIPQNSRIVEMLFDRSKVNISTTLERRNPRKPLDQMTQEEWEELHMKLARKILSVMQILDRHLDLRSKEWMNSPVIWEMLSFDEDILHNAHTPLPEALRTATDLVQGTLQQKDIDVHELVNDIDLVIHQTSGRRSAIRLVMNAVTDTDVSATPLLQTPTLDQDLVKKIRAGVEQALHFTDKVLAEAATSAIVRAQSPKGCSCANVPILHISKEDVTRVTGEEALSSKVGDVYLVRSKNVASLGDHYILIVGGLIQKPHGLRPADISYPINEKSLTPLSDYPDEEPLVLLKLNDKVTADFYDAYRVAPEHRRKNISNSSSNL